MTTLEIEQAFVRFHEANPHVYDELAALAREARARGAKRLGIKQIWEVLRWRRGDFTTDDVYRLPNNFHSRYARLLMQQEDDLHGLFDLASLRTPTILFGGPPPGQEVLDV